MDHKVLLIYINCSVKGSECYSSVLIRIVFVTQVAAPQLIFQTLLEINMDMAGSNSKGLILQY